MYLFFFNLLIIVIDEREVVSIFVIVLVEAYIKWRLVDTSFSGLVSLFVLFIFLFRSRAVKLISSRYCFS